MNTSQTEDSIERRPDPQATLQQRLRLTAIVSVSVSLLGALLLLLTLYLLFRAQPGQSYYQIIQSLTLGQERLVAAMTLAGSVIVLLAGLITWLITLYSSHRIAGPFYRFAKNLTYFWNGNRSGKFSDELETYYSGQRELVDELARSVDAGDAEGIARNRDRLRQLAARASGVT